MATFASTRPYLIVTHSSAYTIAGDGGSSTTFPANSAICIPFGRNSQYTITAGATVSYSDVPVSFFFSGGSGITATASAYNTVENYAALPAADEHSTEIYVVLTSTGIWPFNRNAAGLYYSNGSSWTRLGDYPAILSDGNFGIRNSDAATKIAQFNCSTITAGETRTFSFPDTSGTIGLVSGTRTITVGTSEPGSPATGDLWVDTN